MLLLQFGSMGKELAKYNTKLFAEQVLPKLRPLVLRMGGQVVAGADARRRTRRPGSVPGRRDGGGVGLYAGNGPLRTPARPRP